MKSETIKKLSQSAEGCEIKIEVRSTDVEAMRPIVNKAAQYLDWAGNPSQFRLEFEHTIVFANVELRCDQPQKNAKEMSFSVTAKDGTYDERSALFNLFQNNKRVAIKVIELPEPAKGALPITKGDDKTQTTIDDILGEDGPEKPPTK